MARKNTNAELFKRLTGIRFLRDATVSPVAETLDAAIAAGVTTFNVDGAGVFVAGDLIRIGSGNKAEVAKVEAFATPLVTLVSATALAHEAGEDVVKLTEVNPGDVTQDGVTIATESEVEEVRSSTTQGVYAKLIRDVTQRVSFNLLNVSPENLLAAVGIPETELSGAGTSADPYVVDLDPNNLASQEEQHVKFTGILKDGSFLEVHCWGVEIEPQLSLQFQSGSAVPLAFAFTASFIRIMIWE